MNMRPLLLLAFCLSTGCISTVEEPGPLAFPEDPIRRERAAPQLVPPAEDVTPTERWKTKLAEVAPSGWKVGDAVDQLEAPDGWSRLEGGRGIAFTVSKDDKKFTVWFLPKDWKGKDDGTAPVRLFGSNEEWQLFFTTAGHDGWEKPEEAVANAFGFTPSPRG